MKHTRLLEIIREEIAGALKEAATTYAGKSTIDDLKDDKAFGGLSGDAKADAIEKLSGGGTVTIGEEDQLNEEPFIDSAFDVTGTSPENLNQDSLQKAIDGAVKVLQQENPDADVKKLAGELQKVNSKKNLGPDSKLSSELKSALQKVNDVIEKQGQIFGSTTDINNLIKLAKDPSQIDRLEKLKEKGYTFILGNPQAITAIEKSLGLKPKNNDSLLTDKSKAEKSSKVKTSTSKNSKAKAEPKSKITTLTKGDDGFDNVSYSDVEVDDKEATQNIGSDKTAQKLGKAADVSANPDYNRILKGLQNKRKNSKEGVLSPENMKLAIDIINTAKDKYKFTPVEVEKLRAEINL
jgi:hypothetical protein